MQWEYLIICSEDLFKRTANQFVAEGYADAGYEYIIIDDCWMEWERDNKTHRLVADQKRFPSGLNALADYVSSPPLIILLYIHFTYIE